MLARFPITAEQIDQITAAFYAKVRVHPTLGPVFAAHVKDWRHHEVKIAGFWRNAIFLERSYAGNPMQIHKVAGDVHSAHFPIWLTVFDETLAENLPTEIATSWSALAHRIGRGLRMGLQTSEGPPSLN